MIQYKRHWEKSDKLLVSFTNLFLVHQSNIEVNHLQQNSQTFFCDLKHKLLFVLQAHIPAGFGEEKKAVCRVGAADLAGSGAAPWGLVGPPNWRVGVDVGTDVEAGVEVGSWKPVKPPPVVVAAGPEKLKLEAVEDAGVPKKSPLVDAGGWVEGVGVEKRPPVEAVVVVAAGVVPKLKGEAARVWEARAVPKLKPPPLVPPAVEVVRVGKLNPLPVVLGALAPPVPPVGGDGNEQTNTM